MFANEEADPTHNVSLLMVWFGFLVALRTGYRSPAGTVTGGSGWRFALCLSRLAQGRFFRPPQPGGNLYQIQYTAFHFALKQVFFTETAQLAKNSLRGGFGWLKNPRRHKKGSGTKRL